MAINKKPKQVGLSDPTLVRQATTRLTQDAIAASGKPAIIQGTAVLPRTTVQATATSVNVTTSANNQVADTTTIYRSSGAIYVSSIDQTIQQVTNKNIVNQVGVSQIIAGNNVTITSSVPDGIGIVTINTVLPTYGNVAVLNLDGNSANVLHGDGSWSADITTYGNSNVVTLLGSFGSNSISTTGNVTANVFKGNAVQSTGDVTVTANANSWTFSSTGAVFFPTLTVDLHNGGNQAAHTLQFGNATQQAVITGPTPAANVNAQRLIIQGQRGNGELSEGGDVYFWAGDADLYGGDIKIYAGDADNVSAGAGGYVNIDGGAGFDNGGQVEITGGFSSSGAGGPVRVNGGVGFVTGGQLELIGGYAANGLGGYINLYGGQGETAGGDINVHGGAGMAGPGGNVNVHGGVSANGLAEYGNVNILAGTSTWLFGNDGDLTLPGNIVTPDGANAIIPSTAGTAGAPLTISAGTGGIAATSLNAGDGGNLTINAGDAGSDIGNPSWGAVGGTLVLKGGNSTQPYAGSNVEIRSGNSASIPGVISLYTGTNQWTFENDGDATFPAAGNVNLGNVATANYFAGNGSSLTAIAGGNVSGAVGLATYATTANAVAGANVSGEVSYAATANAVAGANVSGEVSYAATANAVAGGNVSGAVGLATYATTANAVAGANVSGEVSYAATANAVAGGNVSGAVGLATYATTANAVAGANVSGFVANANVANTAFLLANGNSNVNIATANGNITLTATSNTTMTITDIGANITGTFNATGNVIGGNLSTAGTITANGGAYGEVVTTAFASVWGSGAGPNPYSVMQVRSSDGVSGIGMQAFTGSGTLYGNTNINFGLATIRDKDVPSGLVIKAYIDSTGLTVTGIANISGNITGSNVSTAGIVKSGVFNTSNIPAAATAGAGARAFVTDADSVTFKAAYVGGSGNAVPVFSDGSAWYIG